jgi:Ca2+-binding EF-hand superfamily protein
MKTLELRERITMTHRWTHGIRAVGLGLMALVGTASAQTKDLPGPIDSLEDLQDSGRIVFKLADENNDGQISQKEAIDVANLTLGGLFFRADANGDGVLTQDEAKAARDTFLGQKPMVRFLIGRAETVKPAGNNGSPNPGAVFMGLIDANGDKQLQATELRTAIQSAVQGLFATADTNRDGQMSPTEVNAAIVGGVKAIEQASFQAADLNHDGTISKEEFTKALTDPANAAFAILDANNDGQLSQQEMISAGRIVEQQIRRTVLPESPNSLRNLINSGQKPGQAVPVPNSAVPTGTTPR